MFEPLPIYLWYSKIMKLKLLTKIILTTVSTFCFWIRINRLFLAAHNIRDTIDFR